VKIEPDFGSVHPFFFNCTCDAVQAFEPITVHIFKGGSPLESGLSEGVCTVTL